MVDEFVTPVLKPGKNKTPRPHITMIENALHQQGVDPVRRYTKTLGMTDWIVCDQPMEHTEPSQLPRLIKDMKTPSAGRDNLQW